MFHKIIRVIDEVVPIFRSTIVTVYVMQSLALLITAVLGENFDVINATDSNISFQDST